MGSIGNINAIKLNKNTNNVWTNLKKVRDQLIPCHQQSVMKNMIDQRKVRSPQYTMGGRLKCRNASITPGPGINTEDLTRYGRVTSKAYTMAPRTFMNGI